MFPRVVAPILALLLLMVAPLAPVRADSSTDAQAFIQTLAQTAMQSVTDATISDAARAERFRRLFVASFDLPEISRFVLGRFWKTATPEQQQEFQKLFEDIQVITWAQRFKDYHGDGLSVTGMAPGTESGSWVVDSQLLHKPSPPVGLQWKVHQSAAGTLMVTDIIVEGVSMALTQRQDYSASMQSNGNNLAALLAAIRAQIERLGGSAAAGTAAR